MPNVPETEGRKTFVSMYELRYFKYDGMAGLGFFSLYAFLLHWEFVNFIIITSEFLLIGRNVFVILIVK